MFSQLQSLYVLQSEGEGFGHISLGQVPLYQTTEESPDSRIRTYDLHGGTKRSGSRPVDSNQERSRFNSANNPE